MKASDGYTGGAWDNNPADATISEARTFTYTFTAKQAATVTKAPTAKSLTYNGDPQELINAGTADGGTMQYALGTNSTTAPTSGWGTSIPTGTEAETYYVWYKVVGDENHSDTTPQPLTVTIGKAAQMDEIGKIGSGKVEVVTALKDNVPESKVSNLTTTLAESLLTETEKNSVQNGETLTITLEVENITGHVDTGDKSKSEAKAKAVGGNNATVGLYLDISLYKKIGNNAATAITDTGNNEITVTLTVPENLKNTNSSITRTFYVIRIHDGEATKLAETTGTSISFKSNQFSTYALAYSRYGKQLRRWRRLRRFRLRLRHSYASFHHPGGQAEAEHKRLPWHHL